MYSDSTDRTVAIQTPKPVGPLIPENDDKAGYLETMQIKYDLINSFSVLIGFKTIRCLAIIAIPPCFPWVSVFAQIHTDLPNHLNIGCFSLCSSHKISWCLMMFTLWFHQTWLENPRTEWRFLARKFRRFLRSIFQHAMFDYQMLQHPWNPIKPQLSYGFPMVFLWFS